MTKRRLPILVILLLIVLGSVYFLKIRFIKPSSHNQESLPNNNQSITKSFTKNGRKIIGLTPGNEDDQVSDLQVANPISKGDEWRQGVEKALRVQGGDALKDIQIESIDSYIWAHEGVALNVETIRITLTNQNGETTKFKAMIDSSNGKILRTWDHPVVDPINPREGFGIKVDPRYHNEQ